MSTCNKRLFYKKRKKVRESDRKFNNNIETCLFCASSKCSMSSYI